MKSASECILCPPGYICATGSFEPQPCAPGTFAAGTNNTECTLCQSGGYFQSEYAGTACTLCGAGSYSANVLSCLPCPLGLYCPHGAISGTDCGTELEGGTTVGLGAASAAECVCRTGTFLRDGECSSCDLDGVSCTNSGIAIAELPIKSGFWRSHNTSSVVQECFTENVCIGSIANESTSRRRLVSIRNERQGTFGTSLCSIGHHGPFCEVSGASAAPVLKYV